MKVRDFPYVKGGVVRQHHILSLTSGPNTYSSGDITVLIHFLEDPEVPVILLTTHSTDESEQEWPE